MQAIYNAEDGQITEVQIDYPNDFSAQMLRYSATYGLLPANNEYVKK